MRNWNLILRFLWNLLYIQAFRLPMRNWNSHIACAIISVWCFQTTYEELKLPLLIPASCSSIAAFRLPMRNWNFHSHQSQASRSLALSDYLWGIETWIKKLQQLKWGEAFRLPMRNWNNAMS